MLYTYTSGQAWITQDTADDRTFSIAVSEDPSLLGPHSLDVQVTSVDYPGHIAPKTISVAIDVVCVDPQLVEAWTTPGLWEPQTYASTNQWSLPTYQSCHTPYTAVDYEFKDQDGVVLDWLSMSSSNNLDATLSREVYILNHGKTLQVEIKAIDQNDAGRVNSVT